MVETSEWVNKLTRGEMQVLSFPSGWCSYPHNLAFVDEIISHFYGHMNSIIKTYCK